jgi:hypothetical protein
MAKGTLAWRLVCVHAYNVCARQARACVRFVRESCVNTAWMIVIFLASTRAQLLT